MWQTKKLHEVSSYIARGISPKYVGRGGVLVLNQKCIRDHEVNYIEAKRHDASVKSSLSEKLIQVGDVLVNSTGVGTLGRVAQVKEIAEPTVVDSHITIIRPSKDIFDLYFFGWVMIAIEDLVKEMGSGASGQTELSRAEFKQIKISYPESFSEQQRIVKILDEVFEGVEQAKKNAEKNLKNSRELFESYLLNVFTNPGDDWEMKKLGEVCEGVEYGSSAKSKEEGKVPVLRMGNIQNGRFDWDKLVYSDTDSEIEKYLLKHNDVLFNRTNSPALVGKTAIYKSEMPAIFAGYLIRIHRKENLLDADYLNYYLNCDIARDYGKTVTISSVNQANINGKKLKSYPIPVPPLKEQKIIVAKFDELSEQTKKLEAIYKQKIANLDELKKSVLKKAFAGEL